jgi:penicillin-binding protein 2
MKRLSALLCFICLTSGITLLGQTEVAPRPKIISETEVAPKPKIIPEDAPDPAPAALVPASEPKVNMDPSKPVPVAPELLPDPIPVPRDSPHPTPPKSEPPTDVKPKMAEPAKPSEKEPEETARKVKAVPSAELNLPPVTPPIKDVKSAIPISDRNDKNARTLFLTIPAPRGQIVDRNGAPLAQNKMAHFLGLQFNLKNNTPAYDVLRYAKERIPYIQKHTPDGWEVSDDTILEHYKNRRWMPLLAKRPVPAEAQGNAGKELPAGIVIVPCYYRLYPNGRTACHMLGEMGRVGGMTTNPIQSGDTIWPGCEGRGGLEQRFDEVLRGTPGKINLVFSATGEKLSEEITEHPKPGMTVVTSLDLEYQKMTERVLRARTQRGAMVIMEVATGDVISMASNPDYDPNVFAYGVRDADYKKLLANTDKPLLARANNGTYPPASTFKVMTALAALESGKIDGGTYYECAPSLQVGDKVFHNWNRRSGEGSMNVVTAIKRSCNTWFYHAALATGASQVTSMATRFGLGEKTGLCIPEYAGRVPTPEWWRLKYKASMSSGDLMNICIGQGDNLVTPIQACAMMASIARGHSVPRARLVQQVQALDGSIVEFFPTERKAELDLQAENLRLVRAGMKAVVEESDGTGKGAGNNYVSVAGKTGTAQWYMVRGSWVHMAWFAGYIPANNPEYAFAAVYEGDPGEDQISGGRKVAPIVGDVFNAIYKRKKDHGDSMNGPEEVDKEGNKIRKARVAENDDSEKPRKAKVQEAAPEPTATQEATAPPPREGGLRWLWKKMRGKQ